MGTARKYLYNEKKLTVIPGGKKENKNIRFLLIFLIVSIFFAIFIVNELDGNVENTVESAIDWNSPPCSPSELSADWEEVTHEVRLTNSNRRDYRNKVTGEEIAFDKGIPGKGRFQEKNHWHRYNPFSTNKRDLYLDKNGEVVPKGSNDSHIQTNCK